ncbi:MAG: FHA domain-containing protein [Planctomycetaceae bacterium]|nr:FHA domain-containing protein [Planctomycetaceae bacterium]
MSVQLSHGDRRRRWWLRVQAALPGSKFNTPSSPQPSLVPPEFRPRRHGADWFTRWQRDSEVPDGMELHLRKRWSGERLQLPLEDPCLFVGTGTDCQLRLIDRRLGPRHAALLWVSGELMAIDLQRDRQSSAPLVRQLSPGDRLHWGRWDATIVGGVRSRPRVIPSAVDAHVELTWSSAGRRLPTPVPYGLSLVGSVKSCSLRLLNEDVAPIHAAIVRTGHSVWIVDLRGAGSTRVNGQPIEFAPLDPGDELGIGEQSAWLTVCWPGEPAAMPQPHVVREPPPVAENPEMLRQYLLQQTARLTQLQQQLAVLLEGNEASPSAVRAEGTLRQIRQLAAECEQQAARVLGDGSDPRGVNQFAVAQPSDREQGSVG